LLEERKSKIKKHQRVHSKKVTKNLVNQLQNDKTAFLKEICIKSLSEEFKAKSIT